jgi:hypothetical protein
LKAIIHIGTEKTGTTSIQEYLYQNQEQLRDAGFYFIQSAGKRNNRALPSYCMDDERYDDFFWERGITSLNEKNEFKGDLLISFTEEINSIPKGIHTVIISSEHFHSRTISQEEVRNVYVLLSTFFSEIKIVCYIRDQVDTCTSLYSTAIKAGWAISFDDFIQGCKPENTYFNYYEMLNNWERSFGFESLDISIFDRKYFLNGDLLDDFTAKIDLDLVGTLNKNIIIENESLTYVGQVLGKAINKVFHKYRKETGGNSSLQNKCLRIIAKLCKGKARQVPIALSNRICNLFFESNEKLRKKLFPDKDKLFDTLFKEV